MIVLLVLGACEPSAADRALAASRAADLPTALAACPEGDGACQMEAVVRFGEWARCGEVLDPWDDECRFRQAEAVERDDRGGEALELCASTVYVIGCATHVVGQQARREHTAADADARWERLRPHTEDRYAYPYWRGFWRAGIDRGDAPALERCIGALCRDAGLKEIEATVHALRVPCRAADRPPPGWIPADSMASTAAWVEALRHHCVPDAEHPVPEPLRAPR